MNPHGPIELSCHRPLRNARNLDSPIQAPDPSSTGGLPLRAGVVPSRATDWRARWQARSTTHPPAAARRCLPALAHAPRRRRACRRPTVGGGDQQRRPGAFRCCPVRCECAPARYNIVTVAGSPGGCVIRGRPAPRRICSPNRPAWCHRPRRGPPRRLSIRACGSPRGTVPWGHHAPSGAARRRRCCR